MICLFTESLQVWRSGQVPKTLDAAARLFHSSSTVTVPPSAPRMRPSELDVYFAPVSVLKTIGPSGALRLARLFNSQSGTEPRLIDLLTHLPYAVIDRTPCSDVGALKVGDHATVRLDIVEHRPPPRGKAHLPYRILASSGGIDLEIVYFRVKGDWLQRKVPVGESLLVSGRLSRFRDRLTFTHPDRLVPPAKADELPRFEPVYPLTQGLVNRTMSRWIAVALTQVEQKHRDRGEWIDEALIAREGWPSFLGALRQVHQPRRAQDTHPQSAARRRLAYDELLALQVALRRRRARAPLPKQRKMVTQGPLVLNLHGALPFRLTRSQRDAIASIEADLRASRPMLRLLQGDVGSGKTIVALFAAMTVIDSGYQVALMAPLETLARQHYATAQALCGSFGVRIALLTGRERGKARDATLSAIASGEVDLVIGTHALFQPEVTYRSLGLALIDEQHRFGVHQRLSLADKGSRVDLLVMTATPIPRSLLLSHFGDMDTARLDEKPSGRLPITTIALPDRRIDALVERLDGALAGGARVFWICPLIEEGEGTGVTTATSRHGMLERRLGHHGVALVHGKVPAKEKDATLGSFREGRTRLLVATTVIEVGLDISGATTIVIEHSERFGLAQLHQLRGRVGRGKEKSYCLLLYREPLSEVARNRLQTIRKTQDGFAIAEKDLELRRFGELLGTRQSGAPALRLVDFSAHKDLMEKARARAVLSDKRPQTEVLLYLFAHEDAVARGEA